MSLDAESATQEWRNKRRKDKIWRKGRIKPYQVLTAGAALSVMVVVGGVFGIVKAEVAPSLVWPVDCQYGENCFIQFYPDSISDERSADYRGGHLSYDRHDGVDIALANFRSILQGVDVRAAAPGVVTAVRDGEEDHTQQNQTFPEGRECGNGLIIDHGSGWTSQYCHMRKGSIAIRKGQQLPEGAVLGQIGASGLADFPHLHFTVSHNDKIIDPFVANLWQVKPPYLRFGLIDAGFGDKTINDQSAAMGGWPNDQTPAHASHIIAWVRLYGVRAGDKERYWFVQPNDHVLGEPHENVIDADHRTWFGFIGKPKSSEYYGPGWRFVYQYRPVGESEWLTLVDRAFKVQ